MRLLERLAAPVRGQQTWWSRVVVVLVYQCGASKEFVLFVEVRGEGSSWQSSREWRSEQMEATRLCDWRGWWWVKYRRWDMEMDVGVYGGEGSRVGCGLGAVDQEAW